MKQNTAAKIRPPDTPAEHPVTSFGSIQMDLLRQEAQIGGQSLHLPPKEFAILYLLLQSGGELVDKGRLADLTDMEPSGKVLAAAISRLRKRLEPHGYRIPVVREQGYRLEKAVALKSHLAEQEQSERGTPLPAPTV